MNKGTSQPLVSVCIPTYNATKFLEPCLESVRKQSYKNIELIISDDASTDETLQIAKRFKLVANFPVTLLNHTPKTMVDNWNNAIQHAKGTFIKPLFQDDYLHAHCIELMVAKHTDFVYCKRGFKVDETIREDSETRKWLQRYNHLHRYYKHPPENFENGQAFLKQSKELFTYPLNKIGEPTATLIKKEVFEKAGYFNPELNQLSDIEYYYRAFQYCKIAYLNQTLVEIGIHPNQATKKNESTNLADEDLAFYYLAQKEFGKQWNNTYHQLFPIKKKLKSFWKIARKLKSRGF